MRISEYKIHCEMCHLLSDESGNRGFTIQVPIDTASQKEHLLATIFCRIDAQSHQLTLQQLTNSKGEKVTLPESENIKLASVLRSVEERRLCGNAKICPQCIVQLVTQLHNTMKE
ncbi:MAG: hypothetical protein B6D78_08505 [gamma proteobacterium symbiont of Ctena orbiculata]|nr:MAG: hypothetical protein B6D78_08505 [gamma proteobacterium symbiont of Ctena orbiculata]